MSTMSQGQGAPRTLLLTADTLGGVWTYSLQLARALAPHDVHVVLCTMGRPLDRFQRAEVAAASNVELIETRFALEWMHAPWDDVARAGERLLLTEQQYRPDCIQLGGYAHAALPFTAPVIVVGHSCVASWWQAVHASPLPSTWSHYCEAVRQGLHAAQLVVAPSSAMLQALQHHYGPLPRTRVIPNGRTLPQLGHAVKRQYVLGAGRLWDEAKNVGALAAVASQLPWPVLLAGERTAPDGSVYDARGACLLGPLDREAMLQTLSRAAIFAAPARYEPFGLSVLEAAAAGCALVLGDIPSLRENWAGVGLFVAPDDHAALAQALHTLIEDDECRQLHAGRARARAAELSAEAMGTAYLYAYSELLAARAARSTLPLQPGRGRAACA